MNLRKSLAVIAIPLLAAVSLVAALLLTGHSDNGVLYILFLAVAGFLSGLFLARKTWIVSVRRRPH